MTTIRVYTTVEPATLAQVQAWMVAKGWRSEGPDHRNPPWDKWLRWDGEFWVPSTDQVRDWSRCYYYWLTDMSVGLDMDTATLHAEVTKLAKGSEPMDNLIPAQEIADLLNKAMRGEVPIELLGESWDETYAGDVWYQIGAYTVVIFNDCDSLDYVTSATCGDRHGDFDTWKEEWFEGKDEWSYLNPSDLVDHDAMVAFLKTVQKS